jgi:Domain of unknown function (DUF4276)
MMVKPPTIHISVEGDGDMKAAPVLLRRVAGEMSFVANWEAKRFARPLLKIDRAIDIARKFGADGLLVLGEGDVVRTPSMCIPMAVAAAVRKLRQADLPFPSAVVVADQEFESWFLPCLGHLAGTLGLDSTSQPPPNLTVRNAKGEISKRISGSTIYKETVDQVEFARAVHLACADQIPSFGNLRRAVAHLHIGAPGSVYPNID